MGVLVLGGGVFAYCNVLPGNLHDGVSAELRNALRNRFGQRAVLHPAQGTDGSNDREASAEFAGDQFRSDSIILARIDPVDKKATLVSIHRDTLVDMGNTGRTS
ncbi:MAG: LCP family protein [Eggerthella lenta]